MSDNFSTSITINSNPTKVWQTLTDIEIIPQWLDDPGMEIEVLTNWQVNTPIIIKGFHHVKFENKGLVLAFDKERKLSFTHLSSVSKLPDIPESYSMLTFILEPIDNTTKMILNIENFPTESIRKHLEFYWRTTLFTIKNTVEKWI
ncbi:SRPBCC domain-containing protein [Emticicia sp. BO119]|uniref:SRPBCC family protein n=1 Tax=Emticicia sp. BO119 TaxID=2757768 RepID=UPI0015F0206C|nr:SRPBCC domain-containing protein [Emticicia sp. BO119]MBA4849237.1 SRPBCC domain-containing protein [Emticicia sp. BO119]